MAIRNMQLFNEAKPAGFDGVFDWDFLQGCFGDKIMPMDLDGMVERNGYFLIFETKTPGKPVPQGQMITLEQLRKTGLFTVFIIWGKTEPEQMQYMTRTEIGKVISANKDLVRRHASQWYEAVNSWSPPRYQLQYESDIKPLVDDLRKKDELLAEYRSSMIEKYSTEQSKTESKIEGVQFELQRLFYRLKEEIKETVKEEISRLNGRKKRPSIHKQQVLKFK